MTFLKIHSSTWQWNLKGILPQLSQNSNFPPWLQLHWPFNSLLIFKISITECTFIKMQEIKTVYWRKLLYTPVGSCRFFTFVYSAEMKYLVLKSRRWLGELNIPLTAEVWCLIKLLFTNLCHQKAQETLLDYRRWKFKPLKKLPVKHHTVFTLLALFVIIEKWFWPVSQPCRNYSNLTPPAADLFKDRIATQQSKRLNKHRWQKCLE